MTLLNGAAPAFVVAGGVPLALLRGLFDAALFSAFGTLLFWTRLLGRARAVMPEGGGRALDARLLWLSRLGLATSLLAGAGWLAGEAGMMADAAGLAGSLAAVPTVLRATWFGHLVVAQAVALLAAALLLAGDPPVVRRHLALALAAAALLLQAGHGHAMAMAMATGPSLLLLSAAVHLLAGAAWLGGLLPLLLAIRLTPPRAAGCATRSFSVLGRGCVVAMAITGTVQGWVLEGSVPALLGTAHGWTVCVKTMLFVVLLAFAWINRYRLAPALRGANPGQAGRRLGVSIAVQSGVGLLVILAAGLLASLTPGMHEQPVWPFTLQPSLVTIREDAELRREALIAVAGLGAALAAAGAGLLLRRRRRILALAVAGVVAGLAVPHLDLLFVEASPTSFYRSPTGFAPDSIMQGAALYPAQCGGCHGRLGRGDGPLAAALPVPPADLTATHLWMHDDGTLFWWLTHGIAAPDGGRAMPGFAGILSADQRWALIDFIHARNAGLARQATGDWPAPLRAPAIQATCAGDRGDRTGGLREVALGDLHGRIVRLTFGAAPDLAEPGVVTVRVGADPAAQPSAGACVASDRSIPPAYAILLGREPGTLGGIQLLVDADGWLRQVLSAGDAAGLQSAVRGLRAHPPAPGGAAAMRMAM